MGVLSDLYRIQTDFDFRKLWKWMTVVSVLLMVVSIASLFVRGLNMSIDFRGGAVWEVPSRAMTTDDALEVLGEFGKEGGAKIQSVTDANGRRIVRVQAEEAKDIAESDTIARALAEKASSKPGAPTVDVTDVATNTVGPSWGASLTRDAVRALVVFFVIIAMYMSWTLEWRMAVSALIAVVHDVVVTVGFYSVFGFEVTPATVISVLTILGFSLYDTIVVYDRVRENGARWDRTGKYTYQAIMRRSLNQVLMRSVNTTFVAILPVAAILVIGGVVFGEPTMMDFSLALIVGLVIGAYSSIGIASPALVVLKEREPRYQRIRARATERGPEALAEAEWVRPEFGPAPAPAPVLATVGAGGDADAPTREAPRPSPITEKAAQYQRPTPPRPRKQGKKR